MKTLRGRSFHPIEFIRRESCAYGKFCNTLPVRRAHTLICDGAFKWFTVEFTVCEHLY